MCLESFLDFKLCPQFDVISYNLKHGWLWDKQDPLSLKLRLKRLDFSDENDSWGVWAGASMTFWWYDNLEQNCHNFMVFQLQLKCDILIFLKKNHLIQSSMLFVNKSILNIE